MDCFHFCYSAFLRVALLYCFVLPCMYVCMYVCFYVCIIIKINISPQNNPRSIRLQSFKTWSSYLFNHYQPFDVIVLLLVCVAAHERKNADKLPCIHSCTRMHTNMQVYTRVALIWWQQIYFENIRSDHLEWIHFLKILIFRGRSKVLSHENMLSVTDVDPQSSQVSQRKWILTSTNNSHF